MARRKKVSVTFLLLFIAALACSLLVTVSPYIGLNDVIPTWEEVFSKTGISTYTPSGTVKNSVHFIDVGQADCVLIKSGGEAALIDAGNVADSELVTTYLKNAGVQKLTLAVASHPHEDHIGGMAAVVYEFEIETMLMKRSGPESGTDSRTYENLLKAILENDLEVVQPSAGQAFTIGDFTLTVLGPSVSFKEENNQSVIARVQGEGVSFLFTGDAEKEVEQSLLEDGINLKSDVLKVGHHGSNTSSTEAFLAAVSPSYGVIMVGADNNYRHPSDQVMERLDQQGVICYRTDVNGTVVFNVEGGKVNIVSEY